MDTAASFSCNTTTDSNKPITKYDLDDFESVKKSLVGLTNRIPQNIYDKGTPALFRFLQWAYKVCIWSGKNTIAVSFDRISESIHRTEKLRVSKRSLTRFWSEAENGLLSMRDKNGQPYVRVSDKTNRNHSTIEINPIVFTWFSNHDFSGGPKMQDTELTGSFPDESKKDFSPIESNPKPEKYSGGPKWPTYLTKNLSTRSQVSCFNINNGLTRGSISSGQIQTHEENTGLKKPGGKEEKNIKHVRPQYREQISAILFVLNFELLRLQKAGKLRAKIKRYTNHALYELVKILDLESCVVDWLPVLKNWNDSSPKSRRAMIREYVIPYLKPNFEETDYSPKLKIKLDNSQFLENRDNSYKTAIADFKAKATKAQQDGDLQLVDLILIAARATKKRYLENLKNG